MFAKYLAKIGDDDPKVTVGDGKLIFKAKRGTQTLHTIPGDTWDILSPEGDWVEIAPGFVDAIARLRPFISTDYARLQFCCIGVWDGVAYATNNVTVARAKAGVPNGSYPFWLIEFICKARDDDNELRYIAEGDSSFSFRWEDGTQVRAQKLSTNMPDMVQGIYSKYEEPDAPISEDFRAAYEFVGGMSDANVYIEPDRIWTPHDERGKTETMVDCPTSGPAIFATRFFDNVMNAADFLRIEPSPNFASFKSANLEGMAMPMNEVNR
jgi:hypothetical protein